MGAEEVQRVKQFDGYCHDWNTAVQPQQCLGVLFFVEQFDRTDLVT